MLSFVRLAWRNLFRNKRRTLIAGLALGLGLAALIFVDALTLGMVDSMVRMATSSFMGEAQIMHKDFRAAQAVEETIAGSPEILAALEVETLVDKYAPRVLSQELFRISGIYDIKDRAMNSGLAFVRLAPAQRMLGIGQGLHQVAIKFRDLRSAADTTLPFWKRFATNGNVAVSWRELLPQLQSMIDLAGYATMFIGVILIGVVAFVILNTLFMSIFERMFEFGVLRALGTRPIGIAQLILFEAGALAVISIAIGCAIALVLTAVLSVTGLNYGDTEFYGMALRELIYPVVTIRQYVVFPVYILLFTIVIGIYPAIHAARIAPAQAMKKSF